MYCTATEIPEKRRPAPSSLRTNPRASIITTAVPGVVGDEIIYAVEVRGDEQIPREPKTKWVFALNESKRIDGKTDKKIWNICTISYWTIINDYIKDRLRHTLKIEDEIVLGGTARPFSRYMLSKTILVEGIDIDFVEAESLIKQGVDRHFPKPEFEPVPKSLKGEEKRDAEWKAKKIRLDSEKERQELVNIVIAKYHSIVDLVIEDFKTTEEFTTLEKYLAIVNVNTDKLKQEEEDARAYERRIKIERADDFLREIHALFGSRLSSHEKELAVTVFNEGFKTLAKKHHPDVGGDENMMKALNALREKLTAGSSKRKR